MGRHAISDCYFLFRGAQMTLACKAAAVVEVGNGSVQWDQVIYDRNCIYLVFLPFYNIDKRQGGGLDLFYL